MAKKKSEEYISKAKTTAIRFTSRASIKYRDNFYTLECCEERSIPDLPDVDIIKEKELLPQVFRANRFFHPNFVYLCTQIRK